MPIHSNATGAEIHVINRWTVANEADRLALSVSAEDFLKVLYQEDTKSFYALTDTGPAEWTILNTPEYVPTVVPKIMQLAFSDEATPIEAGVLFTGRFPYPITLTEIRANLKTAQTSGTAFSVDVKVGGVSVFSTLLTIDNTEKTSVTAATPAVISFSTEIADDTEFTVTVTVGDGTAIGGKLTIIGE